MKTIKTGFGIKKIEDCEEGVLLLQLRELLTGHRAGLIQRLTSDLPMYIEYKFNIKADKRQLDGIKERLYDLKNSTVDLDKYNAVVQDVVKHDATYVVNEPFYQELNDCIGWYLKDAQLSLVK
jgi:hypothetical protein